MARQNVIYVLLATSLLSGVTHPLIGPTPLTPSEATTTTTTTDRDTSTADDRSRSPGDREPEHQSAIRHYRFARSERQSTHLQRLLRSTQHLHTAVTMDFVSSDGVAQSSNSSPFFSVPRQPHSSVGSFPPLIDFLVTVEAETTTSPKVANAKDGLPSFIEVLNYDYIEYIQDLSIVRVTWSADPAFTPTVVIYGMAFLFGLVGNLLVIVALLTDRKRDSAAGSGGGGGGATNSFLVSLAVADVLFLVVCLPYEIGIKMGEGWRGGRALCKFAAFVEDATATASVLNLMSVSIERYVVIVHPLKSRTWCSASRMHKIIGAVWIASALLSAPVLHVMDTTTGVYYNNETYVVTVSCLDSNNSSPEGRIVFSWYQLIIVFLIPVVTIIYCYAFVIAVLWISAVRLASMTQSESHPDGSVTVQRITTRGDTHRSSAAACRTVSASGRRRSSTAPINTRGRVRISGASAGRDHSSDVVEARKQVIRMLLAIVVVFFCCWGPKWIFHVMKRHNLESMHTNTAFVAWLVVNLLPYVQSCINPIIYSFMSHNFRRTAASLWHRVCVRCRRQQRDNRGIGSIASGVFSATGNRCGGAPTDEWKFVELAMDTRSAGTATAACHVTTDVRLTSIRSGSFLNTERT